MSRPGLHTAQRVLEGWLPFAQDTNQLYGWQLDGPSLEALIIVAAPALMQSRTLLAARAVLWQRYCQQIEADL